MTIPLLFLCLLGAVPNWELTTSMSYVYGVSPDGSGGVWCASSGGVFNFSSELGIGTTYTCPENLSIPDSRDVLSDSDGNLWVATNGAGVTRFDGEVWVDYSSFEGIPGDGVVNSLAEAGGFIWAGCNGGLARGSELGFFPIPRSALPVDDIYSVESRNDTLWLCTNRGIYSLPSEHLSTPTNPDYWSFWPETQDLQLSRIRLGEQSVYICGNSGALELVAETDSFKYLIDYSSIADSAIVDIQETSFGLFAAGKGVMYKQEGSSWIDFGSRLPANRWPTTIFETGEALYCAFSYVEHLIDITNTQAGLGFYRLSDNTWENLSIPGIQCKNTHQMSMSDDGRLYVGTYIRGVQAFYPGYGWATFAESEGMPNGSQTFSVGIDPSMGVWASSYHHGLCWIQDNATFTSDDDTILTFVKDTLAWHSPEATIIYEDLIPNNQPVMLTSQSNGMWAAFTQFDPAGSPDEPSGILGFNGYPMGTMNWAPRMGESGIASINTRSVYPASSDSLWIAFDNGAGCQLLIHSGNPGDSSEDLWLPGSREAFTTSDGLPSNEVYAFLNASGVGLLAATGQGLALFTGSGFTPYLNINDQIKAFSQDSRGRIWCLGELGVYRISDGQANLFSRYNSDYFSSDLYFREYSAVNTSNGGVLFSSREGFWSILQDGGSNPSGVELSFYPQPFISGTDQLRLCGPDEDSPVSVSFYRLDGSFIGLVEASSVSDWIWDGSMNGKIVSSGVYMVLVTVGDTVYQDKISVVR